MTTLYEVTTDLIANDSNKPVTFADLQEIVSGWHYDGWDLSVEERHFLGGHRGQVRVYAYRTDADSAPSNDANWVTVSTNQCYLVIAKEVTEQAPAPSPETVTIPTEGGKLVVPKLEFPKNVPAPTYTQDTAEAFVLRYIENLDRIIIEQGAYVVYDNGERLIVAEEIPFYGEVQMYLFVQVGWRVVTQDLPFQHGDAEDEDDWRDKANSNYYRDLGI